MALQHLRSSTANKRPVPGNMSEGQLAMNTASGSPGLFFKDSNANLVKVGPVHVGTTAPNASPASGGTAGNSVGEQWLDTSSSRYVFKIWDGSAWRSEAGEFVDVAGDVMTGALGIIAGSAGSPGLYFSGDTNTGIYSPGADQVAISTNGTGRLFVASDGKVGISTASPDNLLHVRAGDVTEAWAANSADAFKIEGSVHGINLTTSTTGFVAFSDADARAQGLIEYLHASDSMQFRTAGSERARIDSSGRLLVGTSTSVGASGLSTPQIQFSQNGASSESITSLTTWCGTSTGFASQLHFRRSYSDTLGTHTVVVDGARLGTIRFTGSDGTDFKQAATIFAEVDGTPGLNDMPGRLVFSTTADGASSPTEQLRITNDGVLAYNQPSPTSKSAAATLTVAELKTGIIQYTGGAATLTLPTGTLTEGGFNSPYISMTFEWSVINTGSGTCTIGQGTAHTITGGATVAAGASGRFATRRTASNTYVSYRLS